MMKQVYLPVRVVHSGSGLVDTFNQITEQWKSCLSMTCGMKRVRFCVFCRLAFNRSVCLKAAVPTSRLSAEYSVN